MATPQKSPPGTRKSAKSPQSPGNNGSSPSIAQSLSQMSLSGPTPSTQLATRQGLGKLGTAVKAKVNFYSVDVSKTPTIFDYTVTITSKDRKDSDVKSRTRARVLQLLLEKPDFKHAASDYSKRIVSTVQITNTQGQGYVCTIDYFESEENVPRTGARRLQFTVAVRETGQFRLQALADDLTSAKSDLTDMEKYTSALNILFSRYYGQNTNIATSARRAKFFNVGPEASSSNLSFGLNVVLGYFRAVKTTINGLMLNINTAAAVMFRAGPLDRLIQDMTLAHTNVDIARLLAILSGELKGLRVTHQFFGHSTRKTVSGIAIQRDNNGQVKRPTAENITFMRDRHPRTQRQEDQDVTVAQHFEDAYPNARSSRTAWVVNLGSSNRPNFVPSDLLQVLPDNLYHGLVPHANQGSTMIKVTCRLPELNRQSIQADGLQQLGVGANNPSGPQARFNIVVNSNMMTVNARMLPPPDIMYTQKTSKTKNGSWNLAGVKFKTSCPTVKISWFELRGNESTSALNFPNFKAEVEKGLKNYCSFNNRTELVVLRGSFLHVKSLPPGGLKVNHMNTILAEMKQNGIGLVFVILPDKSADNYHAVKMAGDVVTGIHTICTVVKPGRRPDSKAPIPTSLKVSVGEIGNLMMKLNMKLGGVNLAVHTSPNDILHQFLGNRIMFVGADVGHAAPGSLEGAPSVAGVVATTDQCFFRYAGSVRLQNHLDDNKKSIEYILQFGDMMIERLRLYQKRNNQQLPQTIVIYRDGVADNMFVECVNKEVSQIKRACREVYGKLSQPKVVFIVAQKRHHTRFYKNSPNQSDGFDGNGNPKPGFVVDNQICDSRMWDWYLTSHICLKGTSRAAHYTVLHNETNLSADQLQLLTHHQCWLLGRSSTSISIHPAARHADLLCDRVRVYLRTAYVPRENGVFVAQDHWPGDIHGQVRDDMFWI